MKKPNLGEPRIFVEVVREIGDTGQHVRVRKEISLDLWRNARFPAGFAEAAVNECLQECRKA